MTNSDEGSIFINSNFTSEMTVEQYVAGLMPTFNEAQVQKVANMYKGIGLDTVFAQADAIMGECECPSSRNMSNLPTILSMTAIFVCPTYMLLNSFKGTARKVSYMYYLFLIDAASLLSSRDSSLFLRVSMGATSTFTCQTEGVYLYLLNEPPY